MLREKYSPDIEGEMWRGFSSAQADVGAPGEKDLPRPVCRAQTALEQPSWNEQEAFDGEVIGFRREADIFIKYLYVCKSHDILLAKISLSTLSRVGFSKVSELQLANYLEGKYNWFQQS